MRLIEFLIGGVIVLFGFLCFHAGLLTISAITAAWSAPDCFDKLRIVTELLLLRVEFVNASVLGPRIIEIDGNTAATLGNISTR